MFKYIYDISLQKFLNEQGDILYNVQPLLVFGEKPTWKIKIKSNREDVDISEVTAWASAVAEDYNPLTVPMCRTVSGITVEDGFVVAQQNTRTESFRAKTANRSARSCIFELVGLNGDGETCIHVSFGVLCKISLDPMSTGDLPPIETTDMTSAQVQAIATGAAREEVAEIQSEIEQAKQDAEEAAEAAQEAAESIPTTEGATAGQVLTIQEDGSAAYSDPEGGEIDSGLSTTSENPVQNKAIASAVNGINAKIPQAATAQNQLADKEFVNSSINALAAFPITRDAQKNPFRTRGELLNATTYYSGGEVRVPTRNDYAFVQSDEYYGTAVDGYTDFALTEEYVGYYVLDGYDKTMVTAANKDDLGIVPGTTVPYVELPSTRYIYNGTGFEFQFIINQSGLTAVQLAALNSGITAGKVAKYDGYETGKADLVEGKVPSGQLPVASGVYTSGEYPAGIVHAASNGAAIGLTISAAGAISINYALEDIIDRRISSDRRAIVVSNLDYAVRSVSPLVTVLPADAASPIALTDASATTRNHSWTYTHAPDSAPTYTLPAVTDSTITHEIVLYLDLASTASFSFTDSGGATVSVDTNDVTPALGECWTLWAEYLHGAWIVRGMRDKEAQV